MTASSSAFLENNRFFVSSYSIMLCIPAIIIQLLSVNLCKADGTDPQPIFEKVCAEGEKQIVRLARPIGIEFHNYSGTGSLVSSQLANGIASIRANTNLDLRFTPGADAAGESNIIIFLLPWRQDAVAPQSINEITTTIERLSAHEGIQFDKNSYVDELNKMYETKNTRVATVIIHKGELKVIILSLKSPYMTNNQNKYMQNVIVSFLGFNGKSPNVTGTVFARPGAEALLFGPGVVEFNYLKSLYKSPERGNMLCPNK